MLMVEMLEVKTGPREAIAIEPPMSLGEVALAEMEPRETGELLRSMEMIWMEPAVVPEELMELLAREIEEEPLLPAEEIRMEPPGPEEEEELMLSWDSGEELVRIA